MIVTSILFRRVMMRKIYYMGGVPVLEQVEEKTTE
jgi:hypothetical protein